MTRRGPLRGPLRSVRPNLLKIKETGARGPLKTVCQRYVARGPLRPVRSVTRNSLEQQRKCSMYSDAVRCGPFEHVPAARPLSPYRGEGTRASNHDNPANYPMRSRL